MRRRYRDEWEMSLNLSLSLFAGLLVCCSLQCLAWCRKRWQKIRDVGSHICSFSSHFRCTKLLCPKPSECSKLCCNTVQCSWQYKYWSLYQPLLWLYYTLLYIVICYISFHKKYWTIIHLTSLNSWPVTSHKCLYPFKANCLMNIYKCISFLVEWEILLFGGFGGRINTKCMFTEWQHVLAAVSIISATRLQELKWKVVRPKRGYTYFTQIC